MSNGPSALGGAKAAARGECDIASVHLMDPATGRYNRHLLDDGLSLLPGYRRMQGLVFREGDARFAGQSLGGAVEAALADAHCVMVNRNAGSGTRILIDRLLGAHRPAGYGVQTKSHNAVAAAVQQHRADWGVAIDTVASPSATCEATARVAGSKTSSHRPLAGGMGEPSIQCRSRCMRLV